MFKICQGYSSCYIGYDEDMRRNPIYWGKAAAGIMFFCKDTVLLTLRSRSVEQPGTWGIPGGSISGEDLYESEEIDAPKLSDEDIWQGALRETEEELGSLPPKMEIIDKVIFEDEGFTYTTFLVEIPDQIKTQWKIEVNWESDRANWFPRTELPAKLHPGVNYVIQQRRQYFFDPSQYQTSMVPEWQWSDWFILPKGTSLWHGSHKELAEKIKESKRLSGTLWTREKQAAKTSGGELTEEGLIWFFTDIRPAELRKTGAKRSAAFFAHGFEAKFPVEPGLVFEVITPKDFKIINRYHKLTAKEAKILASINKRQHYDAIQTGTTLNSAVYKLCQWSADPKGFKDVLPLLDFDGIAYSDNCIALLADEISVQNIYPPELS